jgi:preprotein translocase subunit SecF
MARGGACANRWKDAMIRPLRLVPDNTSIRFMRGRFAGLIVSAVLSIASVMLYFYPGLNYGVDFEGGVVAELRFPQAVDLAALRAAFGELHFGDVSLQQFGSARDVLARFNHENAGGTTQGAIQDMLAAKFPGSELRRLEVVGARVSQELFRNGFVATSLALVAVLIYIWFRFDWQFGVGVVGTLLLDITKTVGFLAVTRLQFDLNAVAAILLLVGYSVTDKVVVYDRIRENLRKYKSMPLRELIDLSINQTLGRTVATSLTVLLSIVPLAVIGGEAIRGFALTIMFGIVVGTSSSIFIASPILLFLGEKRLRPAAPGEGQPAATASAV